MNELPPRWLTPDDAARYVGVRTDALRRLVRAGRLPPPTYHLGRHSPRYDREAIDSVFAGKAPSTDIDTAVQAFAEKVIADAERKREARRRK